MGEIAPIDWPDLDDETEYLAEVEVYIGPESEDCVGGYEENTECLRTGFQIKYWTNSGQECTGAEGLCPYVGPESAQRLVNVSST